MVSKTDERARPREKSIGGRFGYEAEFQRT